LRFFFYGTLLDPDIRRTVLGVEDAPCAPALLADWRRVFVRGDTYPVLVRRMGETMDGLLSPDLTADAVRKLRAYEGPSYRERALSVEAAGQWVTATVFVPKDPGVATGRAWHLSLWQKRHKPTYLHRHGLPGSPGPAARGRATLDSRHHSP